MTRVFWRAVLALALFYSDVWFALTGDATRKMRMRVPVLLVAVFLVSVVRLAQGEPDDSPETSPIPAFQDQLTCSQTGPSSWSCNTAAGKPAPVECNIMPHEAHGMPKEIAVGEFKKFCPHWNENDWNDTD